MGVESTPDSASSFVGLRMDRNNLNFGARGGERRRGFSGEFWAKGAALSL